jgi:SAM-dependent methyltransferase
MSDRAWGQGYITDADYADTYFRELSPTWLTYVAALHGVSSPRLDRPFRYLELGCGYGQSAIVHAAAFPQAAFHACDFNAAHIQSAIRYAAACGVDNVSFLDAPFDDVLGRELPDAFDFIGLHGVYSWIDATTRAAVRRVVAEKLTFGGLVYVSYNCLPGWSVELPLRRLLRELAAGASGDSAARTRDAVAALSALAQTSFRYFKTHPSAVRAVDSYARSAAGYIAHEFLNEAWEPFYSVDVVDDMASIDLHYVGSATLPDNHDVLTIDERSAEACARLPTNRQQQLARDFAANRRFRRDVFVKGRQPSTNSVSFVQTVALETNAVVGCIDGPESIATTARVPRGQVSFEEAFIRDLRQLLVGGSMTIADIVHRLSGPHTDSAAIARNVELLVAADSLAPFARVQGVPSAPAQRQLTTAVAARVLEQIIATNTPRAVPSEALGYGIALSVAEAEAVLGWLDGRAPGDVQAPTVRRLQQIGVLV